MLGKIGFDCLGRFDGAAALHAASEFVPDAIILDLGMPGLDGLEVARRLRTAPGMREVLLIALTGWDKEEDRRRTSEAGFDHHLAKPVQLSELQAVLKRKRQRVPPAAASPGSADGQPDAALPAQLNQTH